MAALYEIACAMKNAHENREFVYFMLRSNISFNCQMWTGYFYIEKRNFLRFVEIRNILIFAIKKIIMGEKYEPYYSNSLFVL